MNAKKKEDGKVELTGVQGKTWSLFFQAKDATNTPVNITNVEIRGQIRKTWDSPEVVASWTIIKTNPTQGEFRALIPATITTTIPCGDTTKDPKSQYVYDFEIEFPDGTVEEIAKGKLLVEWEVTR